MEKSIKGGEKGRKNGSSVRKIGLGRK